MSVESTRQYLTHHICGERYALPLSRAREVLRYVPVTPVPGVPPSVRGVIHVRGRVVPVVDLAVRFGRPAHEPTPWTCFVLVEVDVEGEPAMLGMMVDSVDSVVELAAGDVLPPPPFGTAIRTEFLLGMSRHGDGILLLLDVDRVLAHHELMALGGLSAIEPGTQSASGPEKSASGDTPA
ncbi:chemotaxis protein CheW [Pyxidicoccus parkwayensis]|uniref:Chemotaxis protein CheW n=1 Tax=Pyxidicoccus parkwayensis TaxID=2813578 RepID=A0ABX7NR15_9BACT|nr:chemotaxis protein CheW [Pyxidicoccus parkwaysis]QSQ20005.1 chemotaxis protein CheW [Pyxidicoccus parkwaysis]